MLEKFKNYLALNIPAENTRSAYYGHVRRFLDFSEDQVTQEKIDEFLISKAEEGLKPTSLNQLRQALRSFIKCIGVDLKVSKDDKVGRDLGDYLTVEQIDKNLLPMFDIIFPKNKIQYYEMIIWLLVYTCLRPDELKRLRRKDIDLKNCYIYPRDTKNKDDRLVLIPNELAKLISSYFQVTEEKENAFNIGASTIKNMFQVINSYDLFPFPVNARLMRRSGAKNHLKHGMSLTALQKLLGHADLKTTQIYVEADNKILIDEYKKCVKFKAY